jgi:hypothetical protein
MVAAVVTLFYCLFLFQGYQKLFRDADTGWHIRTGETILAGAGLPDADPYSFSKAGQPWFAWEWGTDVLMGAAHRQFGLAGVAMLYAVVIAAGVWLWFRLHWALGGNFFLACGLAVLLLSTANLHWLARPHVLGWIFVLAAVWYAEAGAPRLWPAAVVGALWANLHASFPLGWIILLTYGLGSFGQKLVWPTHSSAPRRDSSRRVLTAAALAAAASLANPYGWHLHQHLFSYLTDTELLRRIGEFQSFDFHADGALYILAALAVAAVGGVLSWTQRRPDRFLLTFLLSGWALRSARGLPIVAIALLPLANAAITDGLRGATNLRAALRDWLDRFLRYSDNLRSLDAGGHGLVWAPLAVIAMFALLQTPGIAARTGFPPDQFPVAAASHVPPHARLLAPDKFGGYLIYRFAGERKVFFDGRSDFYGAEFLRRYGRLVQVRPGWRGELDRHDFTHALLPNDYSLISALEALGWKRVYHDPTATLLARGTY